MEEASSAYGAEMWHELYVMVGGAAGALAGLLFVAVSINLILVLFGLPLMPGRRSACLSVLAAGFIGSSPRWCSASLGLSSTHGCCSSRFCASSGMKGGDRRWRSSSR